MIEHEIDGNEKANLRNARLLHRVHHHLNPALLSDDLKHTLEGLQRTNKEKNRKEMKRKENKHTNKQKYWKFSE